MRRHLWWVVVAILLLGLVGQFAAYRLNRPAGVGHASWAFSPRSFRDVTNKATDVVEADVVSVQAGAPIVVAAQGAIGGQDVIPTENVQVRVTKVDKGGAKAGQTLTIFRTGGATNVPVGPAQPPGTTLDPHRTTVHQSPPPGGKPSDPNAPAPPEQQPNYSADTPPTAANTHVFLLSDDPPYVPGEHYLLALEPRANGTLGPVSPAGRYRLTGPGQSQLQAVGDDPVSQGANGRALAEAVQVAHGLGDIPPRAAVQVTGAGPAAAFRSNSFVLRAVGASKVSGTVSVNYDPASRTTQVEVIAMHLAPGSVHPAHIHIGACGSDGPVVYPLASLKASSRGIGSSFTKIKGRLMAKPLYVNVHRGPGMATAAQARVIACVSVRR